MGYVDSDSYWGDQIQRLENYGPAKRLTLRAIKLFTDGRLEQCSTYAKLLISLIQGALGSWGAALIEPYSDDPSTNGLLRVSPDAMEETVRRFWNDGFQVVRRTLPRSE